MKPYPKPACHKHFYRKGVCKCGKQKPINERKRVETELEAVIREIVWWRDGGKCVEADIDGGRCRGVIQWGHWLSRSKSTWMKFTLSTFCQCEGHNWYEHIHDPMMSTAIARLLGAEWMLHVNQEKMQYAGIEPTVDDLKCRLEVYKMLLAHRPALHDVETLKEAGYYG